MNGRRTRFSTSTMDVNENTAASVAQKDSREDHVGHNGAEDKMKRPLDIPNPSERGQWQVIPEAPVPGVVSPPDNDHNECPAELVTAAQTILKSIGEDPERKSITSSCEAW